jgi:hypothetical protein
MATPPKLQSSFSANDVPTVKSSTSGSLLGVNTNNHAQQHFHNHNASLGRIPAGALPNRHSRELSADNNLAAGRDQGGAYPSIQSALQANNSSYGSVASTPNGQTSASATTASTPAPASVPSYGSFYGGVNYPAANPVAPPSSGAFGVPLLAMSMQNMNVNGGSGSMYPPQNYTGYGAIYPHHSQPRDSQARVIQHRRQMDSEGMSHILLLESYPIPLRS